MEDYASSDDEYNNYEDYSDDDDNDDLDVFEIDVSTTDASEPVKVITSESLLAAQKEDLRKVVDVLSVTEHRARALLIHYRWDVEKVLTILVERGKDELFARAGVTVLEDEDDLASTPPELPAEVMCNICMEDVSSSEVTTMDCGHYFCNTCWTEYFIVKIKDSQSKCIECMAIKCKAVCDEAKVRGLVRARDPAMATKFDRFLLESYIEDNEKVKWCPSVPNCGNAIRCNESGLCEVECACGQAFCFGCMSEPHSPCSCRMWELWDTKCRDESETINWITVNTKPCPQCHKLVDKNGGCNLMHCVCGRTFCWLCGAPTGSDHTYESISGHECGRFITEDKEAKKAKAKKYLDRYIHYHDRYKAHIDSLKLESNLKTTINEKITTLENMDSLSMDFSWLRNGLYRLFRSRRILSYTYPFAYFMFGEFGEELTEEEIELKKNLFEDKQQQLEMYVEMLSACLEKSFELFSEDKVVQLRLRIITLTVVVDQQCKQLYEWIENDLLDSLRSVPRIASYKSSGVDKATEIHTSISQHLSL